MSALTFLKGMCDGQEYRGFPSKEIAQYAKENGFLIIYGASDDLCEIEGILVEEFDVGDKADFSNWEEEPYNDIQAVLLPFFKSIGLKQTWYASEDVTWSVTVNEGVPHETFLLTDGVEFNQGLLIKFD